LIQASYPILKAIHLVGEDVNFINKVLAAIFQFARLELLILFFAIFFLKVIEFYVFELFFLRLWLLPKLNNQF
jgi:hypothetical protein